MTVGCSMFRRGAGDGLLCAPPSEIRESYRTRGSCSEMLTSFGSLVDGVSVRGDQENAWRGGEREGCTTEPERCSVGEHSPRMGLLEAVDKGSGELEYERASQGCPTGVVARDLAIAWMKGEIMIEEECEEYYACRRPSHTGRHASTLNARGRHDSGRNCERVAGEEGVEIGYRQFSHRDEARRTRRDQRLTPHRGWE